MGGGVAALAPWDPRALLRIEVSQFLPCQIPLSDGLRLIAGFIAPSYVSQTLGVHLSLHFCMLASLVSIPSLEMACWPH